MNKASVVVAGVVALVAGTARGQSVESRYYVGPADGVWSDPANWAASPGGSGGAGVPVAGQGLPFDGSQSAIVSVTTPTRLTIDRDYGTASLVTFDMSASNGARLQVTQPQGTVTARTSTLDSTDGSTVSYSNLGGRQVATEPSGTITMAASPGSNVNYLLDNGGQVQAGNLYIGKGGNGTFNHTSGVVSVATNLFVGYGPTATGSYVLGGGTLVTSWETVGNEGTGSLRQTGGVNWADDSVVVGPRGVYELAGGRATCDQIGMTVMAGGTFSQSGGTLEMYGVRNDGSFEMTGGTAVVGAFTGVGQVSLGGEAKVVTSSGHVGSLAMSGTATMDIGMGMLSIGQGQADVIRGYIAAGQLWSSIAAADPAGVRGVGYDADGAGGVDVRCTLLGDADLDGAIGSADYAAMSSDGTGWGQGDFNYDGVVNWEDYLLIDRSYMWQQGSMPADLLAERAAQFGSGYVAELGVSVPEPTSVGLLLAAGVGLVGRRRRP